MSPFPCRRVRRNPSRPFTQKGPDLHFWVSSIKVSTGFNRPAAGSAKIPKNICKKRETLTGPFLGSSRYPPVEPFLLGNPNHRKKSNCSRLVFSTFQQILTL